MNYSYPMGGAGNVNTPEAAALLRAWQREHGQLNERAYRWAAKAKIRIERNETSLELEGRRLYNRRRCIW